MAETLTLTPAAAKRVAWIANKQTKPAILRLSVEGGGCSGFQYKFEMADAPESDDTVSETDGVKLLVDPVSLDLLDGSIVDYVENDNIAALRNIERIIQGIAVAGTEIDKIIVFSVDGDEITSFGRSQVTHSEVPIGEDVTYVGTYQTDDAFSIVKYIQKH